MAEKPKTKTSIPKVVLENESWMIGYWRPMMAWQYFVVCLCDFIIFPSLAMYYASKYGVSENFKWEPITLTAGGFYHIAMGIIVGITAYTRGQENMLRTRLFAGINPPPPTTDDCIDSDDDMYIDDHHDYRRGGL